ncbi:MAG: hypothetical protein ACO3B0_02505, partial [Chitinophagaceae bacterium]
MAQSFYAIDFIENKGQWAGDFQFKSVQGASTIFFNKKGYVVTKIDDESFNHLTHNSVSIFDKISTADSIEMNSKSFTTSIQKEVIKSHSYEVSFVNSNDESDYRATKMSQEVANYFIGGDPR